MLPHTPPSLPKPSSTSGRMFSFFATKRPRHIRTTGFALPERTAVDSFRCHRMELIGGLLKCHFAPLDPPSSRPMTMRFAARSSGWASSLPLGPGRVLQDRRRATFSLPSGGMQVVEGHSCSSTVRFGLLKPPQVGVVAALCCCTYLPPPDQGSFAC